MAKAKKSSAKKAPAKKSTRKKAKNAPGLNVTVRSFRSQLTSRIKELQSEPPATKAAMVAAVSASSGVSKAQVREVLSATGKFAANELCKKGVVRIPDIATLRVKVRPAKKNAKVRNPATGETFIKNLPKKMTVRARPVTATRKAGSCSR